MNQTRRQFFKQVAATCVAAVVAPVVLVKGESEKCGVGNRAKHIVIANGFDCNAPGRWESYYRDLPPLDPVIIRKYKAALRSYKFNYLFGKSV